MCKWQEYDDLGQEVCTLMGGKCDEDCDHPEPSEWDVLNGWFDDDPIGLKTWKKQQQGYSCRNCVHEHTDWCVNCIAYDLYDPKKIEIKREMPKKPENYKRRSF